jgi:hypothetical protein
VGKTKCKGCPSMYPMIGGYCRDCSNKSMQSGEGALGLLLLLGIVVAIGLVVWFFVAFTDAILTAMGAIGLIAIGICVLLVPFVLAALLFKASGK